MTDAITLLHDEALEAESDAIIACLDEDLAAALRDIPWQRRTMEDSLLKVQQIRLMRRLLQKLDERHEGGQPRSNG